MLLLLQLLLAMQPLVRRWFEENGTWRRVHRCGCMLPCCSFALQQHTNRRQLQLRPPHRLQIFGEWACFITFGMVTLKPMARTCTGTTPYCRIGTSTCKPSMQVSCTRVAPQSLSGTLVALFHSCSSLGGRGKSCGFVGGSFGFRSGSGLHTDGAGSHCCLSSFLLGLSTGSSICRFGNCVPEANRW